VTQDLPCTKQVGTAVINVVAVAFSENCSISCSKHLFVPVTVTVDGPAKRFPYVDAQIDQRLVEVFDCQLASHHRRDALSLW